MASLDKYINILDFDYDNYPKALKYMTLWIKDIHAHAKKYFEKLELNILLKDSYCSRQRVSTNAGMTDTDSI